MRSSSRRALLGEVTSVLTPRRSYRSKPLYYRLATLMRDKRVWKFFERSISLILSEIMRPCQSTSIDHSTWQLSHKLWSSVRRYQPDRLHSRHVAITASGLEAGTGQVRMVLASLPPEGCHRLDHSTWQLSHKLWSSVRRYQPDRLHSRHVAITASGLEAGTGQVRMVLASLPPEGCHRPAPCANGLSVEFRLIRSTLEFAARFERKHFRYIYRYGKLNWTCPGLVESLLLTPGQPSRTGPGSGSRASSAAGSDCRTRRCI